MAGILQSGSVTPSHPAIWVTDGVIADGGPILAAQKVLASLRAVDFNSTADQPLIVPPAITAFSLTGIIVTNASRSFTTAVGGFYPAASKAGTPIVAASQVYSALTISAGLLNVTLAAFGSGTRFSIANLTNPFGTGLAIYLALTTAQGQSPATADVYLVGMDLT